MSKRKRRKVSLRELHRHVDTGEGFAVYGRGKFQKKLDEYFEGLKEQELRRLRFSNPSEIEEAVDE